MSRRTNVMSLHGAARRIRVESIRELLYDKQCDPATPNVYGKTAAFMYFISLLNKATDCGSDKCFTDEEMACFTELLWFTYDTKRLEGTEELEIFDMLDYCYKFSDVPIRRLFLEIINVFITPSHHNRYFVDKILEANLSSDYCLVAAMFDSIDLLIDEEFASLRSNFICELFALYTANGAFFEEYLAEAMSSGWTFNVPDHPGSLCRAFAAHQNTESIFSFVKHLICHQIDFDNLVERCIMLMPGKPADIIGATVFVPLSNFINATIDLARILRPGEFTQSSYYNFNETENFLDDFKVIINLKQISPQVASLKNLARMSIREYVFRNHSHYNGLYLLYSMSHIPKSIRNFLCYNYCNFKF